MLHHSIRPMLTSALNANLIDTGTAPAISLASGLVLVVVLLISRYRCGSAT
jgi:hypothetical protein